MSKKTRDQLIAVQRGVGLTGSVAPSTEPSDPRFRRGLQAEASLGQRHNEDQFTTEDGVLSLRVRGPRPATSKVMLSPEIGIDPESGTSTPKVANMGQAIVYLLSEVNDVVKFKWWLPPDLDRKKAVKVGIYWSTNNVGSPSAFTGTMQATVAKLDLAFTGGVTSSPAWTGTTNTVSGLLNVSEFSLDASTFLAPDVVMLHLTSKITALASAGVVAVLGMGLEYTNLYYHTHERTN